MNLEIERLEHQRTEEVNQMKLDFFTQISHDFALSYSDHRTVQELVHRGKQLHKEEVVRRLKLVEVNSRHLLRLIDQLLYFSKSEKGYMRLTLNLRFGEVY